MFMNCPRAFSIAPPLTHIYPAQRYVCAQVAEDAQEGTQLQLPHLKGQAMEDMLNAVYRRYCG
jgi:hypothetical protein